MLRSDRADLRSWFASEVALAAYLAFFKFAFHVVVNSTAAYGFFRDELYFIACSEHLDIGYVDQPPLSVLLLAAGRWLLGDSLVAIRLLPALAGGLTVLMTGLLARELGGGRFAVLLASVASLVSPCNLAVGSFFSMNAFDILIWVWAAYLLVRLINTEDSRYWLWLGIAIGLGALNKTGMLWFGCGLGAALILTPLRRWLRTPWPYLAGGVACLLFSPFVVWTALHDWAHLEFIRNAVSGKYSSLSALSFLQGQVVINHPLSLMVWLPGLWCLFRARRETPGGVGSYLALGLVYATALAILLINGRSKAEYLAPAYGMLFAAGGVQLERWLRGRAAWLKPVSLALLVVGGAATAPFACPVLPVETYIRYADALGVKPHTPEAKTLAELPQFYADMFGWEEKADAVARAFHALSPSDRAKCAVFADNYGRCAALDFFGARLGLPKSIGRHNNYWIWGSRGYTGELMLILGGDLEDKQRVFAQVEVVGQVDCRYCMPYENGLRIYLCRNLKTPLAQLWPRLKTYD